MTSFVTKKRQGGVALLEALIAVVLLALGLLGTIGLQARAYSALSDSGMRAEATIAADKLVGIMSNDEARLADYEVALDGEPPDLLEPWATETAASIPGARFAVTVTPQSLRSRVDITIVWRRKANEPESTHTITSYVTTPKP